MTDVQMTAGVITGDQFETVRYPDDEIRLRVTDGGNVQVIEYISTDREGPPPHSHPWYEVEVVIEGTVEFCVNGVDAWGGGDCANASCRCQPFGARSRRHSQIAVCHHRPAV